MGFQWQFGEDQEDLSSYCPSCREHRLPLRSSLQRATVFYPISKGPWTCWQCLYLEKKYLQKVISRQTVKWNMSNSIKVLINNTSQKTTPDKKLVNTTTHGKWTPTRFLGEHQMNGWAFSHSNFQGSSLRFHLCQRCSGVGLRDDDGGPLLEILHSSISQRG